MRFSANYYSMLAARIQPTYLTDVCQAGFKNCTVTNDMDYCAHLLHDCIGTRNFTQPSAIKLKDRPVEQPLTFTKKENEINQRRCKKQKFYVMGFQSEVSVLFFFIEQPNRRPIYLPSSMFPVSGLGIDSE